VQIADCPGRGERGTGKMDVDGFLGALDRLGWEGHVGLEYRPSDGDTEASLAAWGGGSRP
jgi:hydroxypyruvate isomerase